ncbi:MAG TPA: hypothetical protein PLI09_00900 [Candidatus Hydrogenedentes bacterium]|nr:hypothetical protein [Candidatus Hydrogenedentota bacterium]
MSEESLVDRPESMQGPAESPTPEKGLIRGDKGLETAQVIISAFLIAAAGFIAYAGTWNIPFHGRDLELFMDSAALHHMTTFTDALNDFPNAPMTALGLAKHYAFLNGSPVGLHAINLLLHLMNAVLLYLLCRRILPKGTPEPVAMLAGLFFAVAPYHADAVNFLIGRPYLQTLFFSLVSLILFLRAFDRDEPNYIYAAVAAVFYAFATASHFSAILLPLVMMGIGCLQRSLKKHLPAYLLFCFLFLAMLAAILLTTGHYRTPSAAALYLALAAAPILLSLVFSVVHHAKARTALGLIAAVILIALCSITYLRTALCQDPVAWWSLQTERAPGDPSAWKYLARYVEQQASGLPQEKQGPLLQQSEQAWRQVVSLSPGDASAAEHLGIILHRRGEADESLAILKQAVRNDPFNAAATEHIGRILEEKARKSGDINQLRLAADYFKRAEQLGTLSHEGMAQYAMTLAGLGNVEESYARLRPLAGNDPNSALGPVLKSMESAVSQIRELNKKSLEQMKSGAPDLDAILNRAEMQLLKGETLPASYLLDAMVRKQPENTRAWMLLGVARARMGQAEPFVKEWGGAVTDSSLWNDLVKRCLGGGLWDAAKIYINNSPVAPDMVTPPLVRLADMAVEVKQTRVAIKLLQEAAEASPGDPLPWLKLCDVAITARDMAHAQQYLGEAEKRNAPAEEIQSRRKQTGGAPAPTTAPVNTIIR